MEIRSIMCLAVPGKIISIDDSNPEIKMARVQFGATFRDISIQWIEGLKVGIISWPMWGQL